ncbi:MAG: SDR family NAD(P)-dependent oxidoreductase [Planctomycetota bacterium]|nr:SDR family NAD(P)-dependent oxidoreductase [Planctomycetota bacterium]
MTGGLGGIGLTLAQHLARHARARLVLTSRSVPPPRGQWDAWLANHPESDATSQRILKVRELEKAGAEVLVIAADAADAEAMKAGVAQAAKAFGPIQGVVHAAGVPSDGLIQVKEPAEAAGVLSAKVDGTLVLDRVLDAAPLDFFVVMSSLSSLVGGAGRVDYTAANAFLDAFVQQRRTRRPGATIAINWDGWRDVGMAMSSSLVKELQALGDDAMAIWIAPAEGQEAFDRILEGGQSQVLVATRDFQGARLMMAAAPGAAKRPGSQAAGHARAAAADFVAPANPTEAAVAEIWQEVLGVERVGATDNFFELGGHSLLALQVTTRLRDRMKLDVPLKKVLESETVHDLSEYLQTLTWAAQGAAQGQGAGQAKADGAATAVAEGLRAEEQRDELTL